jgi:hypothetical protein
MSPVKIKVTTQTGETVEKPQRQIEKPQDIDLEVVQALEQLGIAADEQEATPIFTCFGQQRQRRARDAALTNRRV